MSEPKLQKIALHMSDGREFFYEGAYQIDPAEVESKMLGVVNVDFSPAIEPAAKKP